MRLIRSAFFFCAAWLLLLAPEARSTPFEVETFRPSPQHPLLLLAPRESSRSTLTVVFDVGALDDNFENGLTRVSQHALLHANARITYEKLSLALYKSAATLEMSTGLHESRFTLTAAPDEFDALARTLLTSLLSPKLDPRRFKATVERTLRDLQPLENNNWVESLLTSALLEDARYRDPNLGSVEKIGDLEPQRVHQYLSNWLAPRNATIIVTGRFDAQALRKQVEGFQGGIPRKVEKPRLKLPFTRDVPAAREVQVFAWPLNIETARHAAAARVMASLLEERLYNRFRSAGVGYGFASEPVLTPALDVFALILPASESSKLDLGRYLREEVRAVSEGKLEPGSFERNQQATLHRLRLADTDPRLVAEELRLTRHRPAWYGTEMSAALESLTPEALSEVASSWFRDESVIRIHFVVPPPPPRLKKIINGRRVYEGDEEDTEE
ncbi:M16 family metallopeptidase [Archangium lansingense]|uniref:Insulinase family protein n=1 Tax=Archangium lansingense TaxID=2995310 RepID=A0ABT4A5V7_9BACT|nr:insulinase family protein [Archangium lansinium]MCY1076654.1 insulinase family protein [Archangium lansinium]